MSFFRLNDATINAHNAIPVLNQNNHTTFHKLTRYVLVTRVTLLLYKHGFAALYQKKPTRVWKSLEAFRSFFFPHENGIVVLYLREVRRHFGFVWRVSSLTSWMGYILGVNKVAGGFWGFWGGRDEGRYLTVFLLFFLVFKAYSRKYFWTRKIELWVDNDGSSKRKGTGNRVSTF